MRESKSSNIPDQTTNETSNEREQVKKPRRDSATSTSTSMRRSPPQTQAPSTDASPTRDSSPFRPPSWPRQNSPPQRAPSPRETSHQDFDRILHNDDSARGHHVTPVLVQDQRHKNYDFIKTSLIYVDKAVESYVTAMAKEYILPEIKATFKMREDEFTSEDDVLRQALLRYIPKYYIPSDQP